MGLYLDPVIQMAGSIFLGSYCDFRRGRYTVWVKTRRIMRDSPKMAAEVM